MFKLFRPRSLAGVGIYGILTIGPMGSLGYQLMMGTQSMDADNSGIAKDIGNDTETDKEGWYVSASYRVNEWLEIGTYYTLFYPDNEDHHGKNNTKSWAYDHEAWTQDLVLSTRIDINEYWILKFEGHRMEGKANLIRAENNDFIDSPEDDFYVFVCKMTFSF